MTHFKHRMTAQLIQSRLLTMTIIRKTISLEITDEESYEKNLIMYVNIGEPRQIYGKMLVLIVMLDHC